MHAIQSFESPAKLILLGEHFVVFGARALAVPLLALTTQVTLRRVDAPGAHLGELSWSPLTDPHPRRLAADERRQAQRLLEHAVARIAPASTDGFLLDAHSSIPLGYGLGSSAAFAVSLTAALHALLELQPGAETLRAHAHALERVIHGTPSGIDDAVVAARRPLSLRKGKPPEVLELAAPLSLVLASTGSSGSTRDAVARVARLREEDPERFSPLLDSARGLGEQGLAACAAGDVAKLGALFDRAHELLQTLDVSTSQLDTLVQCARRAGAFGAKLTGAGLGGFMVALVPPFRLRAVQAALEDAGGELVFSTTIPATGGNAR